MGGEPEVLHHNRWQHNASIGDVVVSGVFQLGPFATIIQKEGPRIFPTQLDAWLGTSVAFVKETSVGSIQFVEVVLDSNAQCFDAKQLVVVGANVKAAVGNELQ